MLYFGFWSVSFETGKVSSGSWLCQVLTVSLLFFPGLGKATATEPPTPGFELQLNKVQGLGHDMADWYQPSLIRPNQFIIDSASSSLTIHTHNGRCIALPLDSDNMPLDSGSAVRCATGESNFMLESPDGQFTYIGDQFDDGRSVMLYAYPLVAAGGRIDESHKYTTEIDGITSLSAAAISRDGEYLFVASKKQSVVIGFNRDTTTGQLERFATWRAEGKEAIVALRGVGQLAFSPDSQWLVLTGSFSNSVIILKRLAGDAQPQWQLDSTLRSPDLKLPRGVAFAESGGFFFVAFEKSMNIGVYSRQGSDWSLSSSTALSAMPDNIWVQDNILIAALQGNMVFKQDGKLLFMRIEPDGQLETIKQSDGINPDLLPPLKQVSDVKIKDRNTLLVLDNSADQFYILKAKMKPVETKPTEIPTVSEKATETQATTGTVADGAVQNHFSLLLITLTILAAGFFF